MANRPDLPLPADLDSWRDADCDPESIRELDRLVNAARDGDSMALTELRDAFDGSLPFGTAGLRGRMAPGPNRMNTAVVRRAAYALAHSPEIRTMTDFRSMSNTRSTTPLCIIGYDARHRSRHFAEESARVFAAAGWSVSLLPRELPTPVLAFAVRRLGAHLGVMVTASHNPPDDNGYKVYLRDGRQIIAPVDAHIARAMAIAPRARDIPVSEDWNLLGEDVLDDYLATAVGVIQSDTPRRLTIVHTALHGVASDTFTAALVRAGFAPPIEVAEQRRPDPDFPTVAFPNPEEPGALDLAAATAGRVDADIVIAHDPDADRCAVAVPTSHGWRMLTGDEVGALLGWWLVTRARPFRGAFAASIVSGTLLARIAADAGVPFTTTLTGFKWISRVPDLGFGYEEALGYCVDPAHVADKDGITAGLLMAECAATLIDSGSSVHSVLDDLSARFGVHLTQQISVRTEHRQHLMDSLARLSGDPPQRLGDWPVADVVDLTAGWQGLPPTPGLLLTLAGDAQARVIIRPSGTEAKVKAYLQVIRPPSSDVRASRRAAVQAMERLADEVNGLLRR